MSDESSLSAVETPIPEPERSSEPDNSEPERRSEPTADLASTTTPPSDEAPAPPPDQAPVIAQAPSRSGPANGSPNPVAGHLGEGEVPGCTAPQLRRFIKSRTYVPMHELRRRFGIVGDDDEVTGVAVDRDHRVFVGLPNREGHLLGDLFRAGDVGYELSLDPISPIVIGVFPMRPIARG